MKRKFPQIIHPQAPVNVSKLRMNDDVMPHMHAFYEIEFCAFGEFTATVNGYTFPGKRGTLIFYTPNDIHAYRNCRNADILNISFNLSYLNDAVNPLLCENSFVITLSESNLEWLSSIHQKMFEERNSSYYSLSRNIMNLLVNLFLIYISRYRGNTEYTPTADKSFVEKALKYIFLHYREDITISTIAQAVYVSEEHLCREFKKEIGINPKQYITNLRLEYAKNMMLSSTLTLSDIALKSGFHNPTSFSRAFHKHYGIHPNKFRKS